MTPSNPPRAVVRNDRSVVVFREDGERFDLPEWVASHFGLNAEPSEGQAQAAVRAMTLSNPASGTNEAAERLRAHLDARGVGDMKALANDALATERAIGAALDVTAVIESFRYSRPLSTGTPEHQMWERNEATIDAILAALASETPRPGEPT